MSNIIKPLDQHVVNVLSVYAMADMTDYMQGTEAYEGYNRVVCDLVRDVGYRGAEVDYTLVEKMCGVFAALSPNATYASNLSSAEHMLNIWKRGLGIEHVKVSTYTANKIKAWKILNEPVEYVQSGEWTKGKKTYAFYRNIYGPGDLSAPVVVDGHMYSVWMLKHYTMKEAKVGNGNRYDQISNDIKAAARIAGIAPSQMQAVCWFTWKRVNRIAFDVGELQTRLWPE